MALAFTISGCAPTQEKLDPAVVQAAQTQAEEMSQAVVHSDFKKLAELTHAKIVSQVGGKEQLTEISEKAVQSMKTLGLELKAIKVGTPADPVEANMELYTVVPFTLTLTKMKEEIEKESYYIGVSSNGGKKWSFIDGSQLSAENIKQILPDFPSALKLPMVKKK